MNKSELIDAVSRATGLSKADVDRGEKVTFVGFGTFERRQRKARMGVNPQRPTEKIKIPAKKAPAFSAGSELKAAVASGRCPKLTVEAKKPTISKSKTNSKKSGKRSR